MNARALTVVLGLLVVPLSASGQDLFHDPFLNWDFVNFTDQTAYDFEIVVETPDWVPNGHYDGYVNKVGFAERFPNFELMTEDHDQDGDEDTVVRWYGSAVDAGVKIHVGLGMQGSGPILDAYWTDENGDKINRSIFITYELTRVRPSTGEIDMILSTAPAFFADDPNGRGGWANIRTFMDIPADMLGLEDINEEMGLAALANYETDPMVREGTATPRPIEPGEAFLFGESLVDSFFDVYVGDSENLSPEYESLLVADIINQGQVIGRFWNLNPQSPEPATMVLLGVGGLLLLRRRT